MGRKIQKGNLAAFCNILHENKVSVVYCESVNLLGSFTVFYLLIENSCTSHFFNTYQCKPRAMFENLELPDVTQ